MRLKSLITMGLVAVTLVTSAALFGRGAAPARAGGGGCHSTPETEGTGAEVTIAGCFHPTVLRVEPNTRVTFRNTDRYAHVVIGQSWSVSGQMGPAATAEVAFPRPGTFPYACPLHPGMVGVVVVGDGTGGAESVVRASVRTEPEAPVLPAVAANADANPAGESGVAGIAWLTIGLAVGGIGTGTAGAAIGRSRRRAS